MSCSLPIKKRKLRSTNVEMLELDTLQIEDSRKQGLPQVNTLNTVFDFENSLNESKMALTQEECSSLKTESMDDSFASPLEIGFQRADSMSTSSHTHGYENVQKSAEQNSLQTVHATGKRCAKQEKLYREMWQQRYNELKEFREKSGHCNVPQRFVPNKSLGKWVHKQRQEFKKIRDGESSSLTLERVEALEEIGFQCTTSNRAEALWQKRFDELVKFKEDNGHCNVPQKYVPNIALGKWVHRQRHEFKKIRDGDSSFLTKKRIEALVNIGLCTNRQEAVWQQRYKELLEFQKNNGHCNVPRRYAPNKPLGLWVNKQRHELKKKRDGEGSCLSSHRVEALEKIGLHYITYYRKDANWQQRRKKAVNVESEEKKLIVTQKPADQEVGAWLSGNNEFVTEHEPPRQTPQLSARRLELLRLASQCIAKSA